MLGDIFFLSFYSCLYGWCAIHNGFIHQSPAEQTPAVVPVQQVDPLVEKKYRENFYASVSVRQRAVRVNFVGLPL